MENEFYRFELKYEVDHSLAWIIEQEVKKYGMKSSEHGEGARGEYTVTSLYFDSWDFNDHYERQSGLLDRKKLRARIYEPSLKDSKIIWLELKKKHGAKTLKKRVALSPSEWLTFLEKGPASLLEIKENEGSKKVGQEIIWNFLTAPVKPTALIRYLRKPYRLDDLRITFDQQIEACRAKNLNCADKIMTPIENKGTILEVKFSSRPPIWLERIIQNYNLRYSAFSKYSNSIDAIYQ